MTKYRSSFYCKYLRDEQSQAIVSADARGCSTRTKQTNKQKDIQSPVVSVGRVNQTASMKDVVGPLQGHFHSSVKAGALRRTQSIAPTSTVPPYDRSFSPLMCSQELNAWFCCVCSTTRDSGCDCGSQRLSSRMNCGCNSCRRSSCGSGSGSG